MMVLIHQHWFITWTLAHVKYEEFSIFYPLWHTSLTLMGIFPFHRSGSGQRECPFFCIMNNFWCLAVTLYLFYNWVQYTSIWDIWILIFHKTTGRKQTKYIHIPQTNKNWRSLLNLGSCHIHVHVCEYICYTKCFLSVYMCLLMHSFIYLVWLYEMLLLKQLFYSTQTGLPR